MWELVDGLLERGIADGIFPGCAVAAGQLSRVLYTSVHGKLSRGSSRKVCHNTRYDIGALTQVTATVPLALHALETGLMSLDDTIERYIGDVPDGKRGITIISLLTGTSGMPPHFLLPQETESDRDALRALLNPPLAGSAGAKVRDSAMGYILLGFILEKVYAMPFDEAVKRYVCAPMHMRDTGFLPSGDDIAPADGISDEEIGNPQDANARFLHGVAGNAGLFTTLEDMTRFASMLANGGRTDDGVVFCGRAVHLATTDRTRGLNEARGFGFRISKRSDPFLGHLWPSGGYGLVDSASGSLIAVSPDDGFFVTLLANAKSTPKDRRETERVHKLLLNTAYSAFQHEG